VLGWVRSLWLHSGDYGTGTANVIDWSAYGSSLAGLVGRELPCAVLVAVALGMWLATRGPSGGAHRRALAAVLAGVVATWLVAAKSTFGFNYLVPALGLSGSLVALLAVIGRTRFERGPRVVRAVTLVLLAAVPAYGGSVVARYFIARRPVLPGAAEARARVQRSGGEARALLGSRASTVAASMAYANDWAGHSYSDDLRRLYPDVMSFDRLGLNVFGRPVAARELERRLEGDALLLWDTTWEPLTASVWSSGVRLEPLGSFGRDRLYLGHLAPPDAGSSRAGPFAGLLVLDGLPELAPSLPDREALGPTMSAVFFADGRSLRLCAKLRNERSTTQRLELSLNGDPLAALDLAGTSDWTVVERRLAAKPGLNEVRIAFDRTYGPLDERYAFRVPGFARDHVEGERTGVRFQLLQVLAEP